MNLDQKSETLRHIVSNLCGTFRDFLELKVLFVINFTSTHHVGAGKVYQKNVSNSRKSRKVAHKFEMSVSFFETISADFVVSGTADL